MVDVHTKLLREYSEKLQRWLLILDEIKSSCESALRRVAKQNETLNSKLDSVISRKRQLYEIAVNELNSFRLQFCDMMISNEQISEIINNLQKAVDVRECALNNVLNTKSKAETQYNNFQVEYNRIYARITHLTETIIDFVKKSDISINDYLKLIENSEKELNNINNIYLKVTNSNGIMYTSITSTSDTRQVQFANVALSFYKKNTDAPIGYYLDDIKHKEIQGLSITSQSWHSQGDCLVFNFPEETGKTLDSNQGKLETFLGTCGCVSCVNILKLAKMDISEEELVTYAATHCDSNGNSLCTYGNSDYAANGGTTSIDRKNILEAYGVKSELVPPSIENIIHAVSQGKGVIASVHADYLYSGRIRTDDRHAIVITSVKYKNGKPFSIITCDSNNRPCEEYSIDVFQNALTDNLLNVTSKIIR